MPRGGRSRAVRAPAPRAPAPAPRAAPPAPVHAAPPPAPMAAQPKQPGMFAQMAATAGGVAIGSTIGHVVGHALTGGGSAPAEAAPAAAAPAPAAPAPLYNAPPAAPAATQGFDPKANPCLQQLQQFLECTQTQNDISLCNGFNQALKECKVQFGLQ